MKHLSLLANNGDIGGGEVVLLQLADAARKDGYTVTVAAPATPGNCADAAEAAGFEVVRIPGRDRKRYMRNLRRWARHRRELLWCNGLVPATATALLPRSRRVVHLHRLPEGRQRWAAKIARIGAVSTVVLSTYMRKALGYGTVLPNWSPQHSGSTPKPPHSAGAAHTVGFIGRLTPDKGLPELTDAVSLLNGQGLPTRLLVAGEARFVGASDSEEVEDALDRNARWVSVLGWVPPGELFSKVEVLAVPSRWEEPFGLVATEAMAARVPLVITDSGALPEIVGPAYPYVARKNDSVDLARALRLALLDQEGRPATTERAFDRWVEHYTPEVGGVRFLRLLREFGAEQTGHG